MGFLDTIGQRAPQSRAQDARSPVGQKLTQVDAPRASAPDWRPQHDRVHPVVIWGAALIVVAAVAVAGWLAVQDRAAVVSPDTKAAADAPSQAATAVAQPAQKRRSLRRPAVRSVAKGETASEPSAPVVPAISQAEEVIEAPIPALDAGADPIVAAAIVTLPDDDNVYSGEGEGIVAPRLTSLGFIRRPFNGLRVQTRMIELVVSKSGTVERAKIFSKPAHWEDALLLSRAKMLEFVPASRNGSPVRYRFVMDVDSSP
jgi:hypothetical protein